MSDRQSCIWEIAQGAKMLDKICFIVDDPVKYDNIRKDTTHSIHFPEFNTLVNKLPANETKVDFSNIGDNYLGFMMNGNDIESFVFNNLDSPSRIDEKMLSIKYINHLLK